MFVPQLLAVLPLALGLTVPLDAALSSFTYGNGGVKVGGPGRPVLGEVNAALTHVSNLDLTTGVKPRRVDLDLGHTTHAKVDINANANLHHLDTHAQADVNSYTSGKTTLATRTSSLPDLEAGASFCITLATGITLDSGIFLDAGICLCADAELEADPLSGVRVVASSGAIITGAAAVKLRNSMLFAQFGNLFDVNGALKIVLGTYLNIVAAGNICLQVDLFVDYSEHDFSVGPSNCCARRCIAPYVKGPNDQCVCPAANQCRDECLTGPALECNGQCFLQSEYTCPSGMPVPKQLPGRKRHLALSAQCHGHGEEMCAVTGSVGWECVDVYADIESCGGCVLSGSSKRQGTDCTSIPFVDEVLCHIGDCLVVSCEKGYKPARNGTLCVSIDVDADVKTNLKADVYGKTAHRLGLDASAH